MTQQFWDTLYIDNDTWTWGIGSPLLSSLCESSLQPLNNGCPSLVTTLQSRSSQENQKITFLRLTALHSWTISINFFCCPSLSPSHLSQMWSVDKSCFQGSHVKNSIYFIIDSKNAIRKKESFHNIENVLCLVWKSQKPHAFKAIHLSSNLPSNNCLLASVLLLNTFCQTGSIQLSKSRTKLFRIYWCHLTQMNDLS